MYLARVYVTLRPTINDPVGQTIRGGLRDLGFDSVESVRSGKYMELRLDAESEEAAGAAVSATGTAANETRIEASANRGNAAGSYIVIISWPNVRTARLIAV